MLTVYDDADVPVLDPEADPEAEAALVLDAGALGAEPDVDAAAEAGACAVL